jgi:hypothetical protein
VIYSIVWSDPALEQLADEYLAARGDGRGQEFTQALNGLESSLARDPDAQGESRSGPFRVVYDLPANLLFRVDQAGMKVVILGVRYIP